MNFLKATSLGLNSHFVGARSATAACACPAKISMSKESVHE